MSIKEKRVREIIQEEIKKITEDEKLTTKSQFDKNDSEEAKLKEVIVQIFFSEKKITTTDLLLGIRIIKGVNIVAQHSKTLTSKLGRKVVVARLSFIPKGMNNSKFIDWLMKKIKKIEGVEIIKVVKVGHKRLTQNIGSVRMVY